MDRAIAALRAGAVPGPARGVAAGHHRAVARTRPGRRPPRSTSSCRNLGDRPLRARRAAASRTTPAATSCPPSTLAPGACALVVAGDLRSAERAPTRRRAPGRRCCGSTGRLGRDGSAPGRRGRAAGRSGAASCCPATAAGSTPARRAGRDAACTALPDPGRLRSPRSWSDCSATAHARAGSWPPRIVVVNRRCLATIAGPRSSTRRRRLGQEVQGLDQADQGDHGLGAAGRRRPATATRACARRSTRRAGAEHAERHHRPGHQEGHRRARRRQLRGVRLRGVRPGRRRHPGRDHDRQPQPHRRARCATC